MKRILVLVYIGLMGGLLTACSESEPDMAPEGRAPIYVDAAISTAPTTTRTLVDEATGDGTFENNDAIGVYAKSADSYSFSNQKFQYEVANGRWKRPDPNKDPYYWDELGASGVYTFVAYYPYAEAAPAVDAYPFTVQPNQSVPKAGATLSAYEQSDLLWSTCATNGGVLNLTFRHVLSRLLLNITLDADSSYRWADLAKATLMLDGLNTSTTVDLTTSITSAPKTIASLTACPLSAPFLAGASRSFRVITVPQPVTVNKTLVSLSMPATASLPAYTYKIPVPAQVTGVTGEKIPFDKLPAGQQLIVNMKLMHTGLEMSNAGITGWGDDFTAERPAHRLPGIYTKEELIEFSEYWNKTGMITTEARSRWITPGTPDTIKIQQHIVMDAAANKLFKPIGTVVKPFAESYVFDGQGYMLKGLELTAVGECTGLFGVASASAQVIRMDMRGTKITAASSYAGALVGKLTGSATVKDCSLDGVTIVGTANSSFGALVGIAETATTTVNGCRVRNASVSGITKVGGLLGSHAGTIQNSSFMGTVTATGTTEVGGVVGTSSGKVLNSFAAANVTVPAAATTATSFIGAVTGSASEVKNCYDAGVCTTNKVLYTGTPTTITRNFYNDIAGVTIPAPVDAALNPLPFIAATGYMKGVVDNKITTLLWLLNQAKASVSTWNAWNRTGITYYYREGNVSGGAIKQTIGALPAPWKQ